MQALKVTLAIVLVQFLPGFSDAVRAQTSAGSFGVTIVLRSFSEAVTADHRCTHRGQTGGRTETLRISCPATVDIQAIARASASKTGQSPRMNVEPSQPNRSQLTVIAGKPTSSPDPVELTISW